mmetsp:Transcript_3918/g.5735  ORF Transcript_3918/g.5735 Transcript_3918/m.5735 type:complete len:89 (-) Transcript_3918:66-332(-)
MSIEAFPRDLPLIYLRGLGLSFSFPFVFVRSCVKRSSVAMVFLNNENMQQSITHANILRWGGGIKHELIFGNGENIPQHFDTRARRTK